MLTKEKSVNVIEFLGKTEAEKADQKNCVLQGKWNGYN